MGCRSLKQSENSATRARLHHARRGAFQRMFRRQHTHTIGIIAGGNRAHVDATGRRAEGRRRIPARGGLERESVLNSHAHACKGLPSHLWTAMNQLGHSWVIVKRGHGA